MDDIHVPRLPAAEPGELARWKGPLRESAGLFRALEVTTLLLVPLVFAAVARPTERAGRYGTVQVRFDTADLDFLDLIDEHQWAVRRQGPNRSVRIRDAVDAFTAPLGDLLERDGQLGSDRLVSITTESGGGQAYGESTRIRLDWDLLERLDRIAAYARGLGYRTVTRSSLIREAVSIYVSSFKAELNQDR